MLTNDDVKKLKGVMKGVVEDAIDQRTPGIVRKIVQDETPSIVEAIVEKKLKPAKKDLRKIKKDLGTVIDFFDREQVHQRKRLDRAEEHLNLPPMPSMSFATQ